MYWAAGIGASALLSRSGRLSFSSVSTSTRLESLVGTPAATVPPAQAQSPSTITQPWMLVAALILLVLGLAVAAIWRRRGGRIEGDVSGGSGTEAADATVSDQDLIPDEERVITLLEANGGRMRQSAIVNETGWSKAKTSMLLSEMEDDEQVTKLRVGRENIVSLPGQEPEATRSPYDE